MVVKNQVLELDICDLNNLGFGVAHVDGLTLFVSGCVDGEKVRALVLTVKKTYAVAKTLEVLVPSPHRITPACHVKGCGGCAYQVISYEHEREIKREYVRTAFRKVGISLHVEEVVTPQENGAWLTCHYRNKAQYPVSQDAKGNYIIGFYGAKSHRVVEASDCPLQPEEFGDIILTLREYLETYRISAYCEETGKGLLRHIYLRRGSVSGEVLLTLVVNGKHLPHEEKLVALLRREHPSIVGILLNTNEENTNVICGEEYRILWGKGEIVDTLAGVQLKIAPAAFYQVNHAATELLYAKAKELACLTGEEQLLDLYCGCGSIGLSMADRAREMIGIEIEPSAVACAKENATLNGITNARFWCGDATNAEELLSRAVSDLSLSPDVVVLDPPRKGSTPALLSYLATLSVPRIVYISCNPDTLARDAACLLKLGYEMSSVTPFDLFPRTGHVESVVCLTRRLDVDMRR